jgi:hypothetical protein
MAGESLKAFITASLNAIMLVSCPALPRTFSACQFL